MTRRLISAFLAVLLYTAPMYAFTPDHIVTYADTTGGNVQDSGVPITSLSPAVATNALLTAATTASYPNGVWRLDWSAGFGAGPLFFTPQTGTCASNSYVSNGATCQDAAGGNSFLGAITRQDVAVEQFGCDPTGVAEAGPCLARALAGTLKSGGGRLLMFGRYLNSATMLSVPSGVTIKGPWARPGIVPGANYTVTKGSLVTAPDLVYVLNGGGIENMMVLRAGLLNPGAVGTTLAQNMQTAYAQHIAYTGTGITFGDGTTAGTGSNSIAQNNLVIGFETCILATSNSSFPTIRRNGGDCNTNIKISGVGEGTAIAFNDGWEFLSYGGTDAKYENGRFGSDVYFFTAGINAIADNGTGLIRVSTTTAHPFSTGNTIYITGAVSNTGANNTAANPKWTITVISSTQFDLQGSTFANTSGATGSVYADVVFREGANVWILDASALACDLCELYGNTSFAYKYGLRLTNADHISGTVRADTWFSPQRHDNAGVFAEGTTSGLNLVNPNISGYGVGIKWVTSGGIVPFSSLTGGMIWGCVDHAVEMFSGNLMMSGTMLDSTPPSLGAIGSCSVANGHSTPDGGVLTLTGSFMLWNNTVTDTGAGHTIFDSVIDDVGDQVAESSQTIKLTYFFAGMPANGQAILFAMPRAMKSYTNLKNSLCKANTAATASAVFHVSKTSASNFGAMTFAISGTTATNVATAGTIAAGEFVTLTAPSPQDASLANVSCTLVFGPR